MEKRRIFALLVLSYLVSTSPFEAGVSQVFLQRGKDHETIHCRATLLTNNTITKENIDTLFWYKDQARETSQLLLISYFEGQVYPDPRFQHDKYNITAGTSLVINDIKDSDSGHYTCKVKLKDSPFVSSDVNATVVVQPDKPTPRISDCHDECGLELPPETSTYNLTCVVSRARPSVEVLWVKVSANEVTENVAAQSRHIIQEDTVFTTSVTVTETFQGKATWRCYAYGIAMGRDNGSFAEVVVTRQQESYTITPTGQSNKDPLDCTTTCTEDIYNLKISVIIAYIYLISDLLRKAGIYMYKMYLKKKSDRRRRGPGSGAIDIEMTGLIDKNQRPTPELSLGDLMKICRDQLKTYYKAQMSTIPVHPVLLSTAKKIKDIYVDLQLLKETDKRFRASKPVRLKGWSQAVYPEEAKKVPLESQEDLIELLRNGGRVIVVGTVGRGKTTLTRKIADDWTCLIDTSITLPKFVFVLRMEEVQASWGILEAIRQTFLKGSKLTRKHLCQLINEYETEVLFVFDGWNEASTHLMETQLQHQDDISIKDVLSFKAFRNCSVLVTTRPHKMAILQEYYSNFTIVETTGFSEKNRNKYIMQFYSEELSKGEALIKKVSTTAFIQILSQSPIMLLLLCLIWGDEQTLPHRITELYQRAVKVLIRHFASKFDNREQDQNRINQLKDEIGRTAFEGLIDLEGERLVFTPGEFPETLDYGLQIGVLYQESKAVAEDVARMVNFLHKSFQEYFAAHFLASTGKNLVTEKLLPLITVDTIQEKEYLLRFCCGMDSGCAKLIVKHVQGLKEELQTPRYLWIQRFTTLLVFEAQSPDLVTAVA